MDNRKCKYGQQEVKRMGLITKISLKDNIKIVAMYCLKFGYGTSAPFYVLAIRLRGNSQNVSISPTDLRNFNPLTPNGLYTG